jgi:hypothetical protein
MTEFTEINIQKLFGHEAAEDEDPDRLREYYFKSSVYQRIVTDVPIRILVGHKGIGKSALLKMAIFEDMAKGVIPILIKPNDITELGVDTSDFLHTVRNWQVGLHKIIFDKVLDFFGIPYQARPLSDGNFRGSVTDYITETLMNTKTNDYPQDKQSVIFQFIETPQPKITVYIDDLDRGWQGRRDDVTRISALLNAVRDLSNENKNIHFRIALRSDVYYLVRTSDESTDKIEGSVVWHTWTNHEIFILLVKRIETFLGRNIDESELLDKRQYELSRYLSPIMETYFSGKGHWENAPTYRVLMSLIRKRPRDLIKLCTLAARHAYLRKSTLIQAEDFKAIFEEYSQGRIQDTANEYRSELPDIERLLMNMKPNKKERTTREGYIYRTDSLLAKLANVMEQGGFAFSNKQAADRKDLAAFLYKINFITARKETSDGILRKYFEENRYLSSQFVDFGFDWEIHPAYRWALQPSDINDYFPKLSADDE